MATTRPKRPRPQVRRPAPDDAETPTPPSADATTEQQPDALEPEQAPVEEAASEPARADDGRPRCRVPDCVLPEFLDGVGVCGGHYATHRGYATNARG